MLDWQSIVAITIVILAAIWLGFRVRRIVRSGSRDGEGHISGCGTCQKNPEAAKTTPLVQLDRVDRDNDQDLPR